MVIFKDIKGKKLINVRDMGGLDAFGGKKIAEGRLFRGGRLADLPLSSAQKLTKLGIKTEIDLRSDAEVYEHPPVPIDGIERVWLRTVTTASDSINDEKTMRLTLKRESGRIGSEFENGKEYMTEVYRSILFSDQPKKSLKEFFRIITEADAPVYFHCNSGKDRTGIFSMLLESVLGVSESEIYADYLHSNKRLFLKHAAMITLLTIVPLKRAFKSILKAYIRVRKQYLQNVIEELKAKYGSVLNYCKAELDLTDGIVETLRGKYLC